MSPWLWWTLAAAAGMGAAWAVAVGDGWGSVGWWLGAAALATAGWRERRWRRALRAVAEGLRRGRGLGWDAQPAAELAAAVAPVLRDVQGSLEDARRREEQLRELLEGLPWGVLVVDGRRRVVWLNRAAGRLVGVDPSHVPGMSAVAVFRRHEVEEVLQAALQTGEAARDLELGAVLEVRARRLPGGQLLVVVQDVTRERRAEAVRRDFVANVSHELRTPLASLRAMAETLRDGGLEDPQLGVRFLAQMLEEVDRMTRLVNDLLDLSALEAGVVRLRREEVQARELLEAVARRYQQLASRRGVHLAVRPGEARLQGDRDRLEQALGNLVDNAVKYTPPGGRVELGVEAGGAEVRLVVEDTGPGVPPEHLPRIFERFYRADPSRSREEGGTGLGLAIAKHIALAHGGRVEAGNRPEGGARFAVVLPAA